MNGYFDKNNGKKYLALVPTTKSKEKVKNYKELWIKTRCLIWSITKTLDDYDEKYMKIKFNLDEELPINKTIEIASIIKVVRTFYLENNKFYS